MTISEEKRMQLPDELKQAAMLPLSPDLYQTCRRRGLSLTEMLEEMDPSQPDSALDAFERQLALAGIRVNGDQSDIIDRFFATTESATLFPEFVSRSVRTGMDQFRKLDRIVATRTRIDSDSYKTIYMDDTVMSAEKKQLARVAEGAELPKIELSTAEHVLTLHKFGRYLEATYEAIRRRRASVVALFLRAIGVQVQRDKFETAVNVIINGDGNSNPAVVQNVAVDDTLTYDDLVGFALAFDPYTLNVMIVSKATAKRILTLSEFKDPAAGFGFAHTGDLITPFGAELVVDDTIPDDLIVGIDRRFAVEEVYETPLTTESDRLIRQQIQGTAITETCGYGKIINAATRVLDIDFA